MKGGARTRRSPQRLDLARRLEFRPDSLAGERSRALCRRERQACAITERKTELASGCTEGAGDASLRPVERDHLQLQDVDQAVDRRLIDSRLDEFTDNLGIVTAPIIAAGNASATRSAPFSSWRRQRTADASST
jgi:hypothetical protein